MIYYAKSAPVETIKEHTNQLLDRLERYKRIYQKEIKLLSERDWELLEIAVKYHDVGKTDLVFQNKIRQVISQPPVEVHSTYQVPHQFLSVMAIPFKSLGLDKEEKKLVSQVVAYHHERNLLPETREVVENYQHNILKYQDEIEQALDLVLDEKARPSKMNAIHPKNRIKPDDPLYYRYVLLKGILHRLDHAASAHVPIEMATDMNVADYVQRYFTHVLHADKRPLQQFTEMHRDHHVVVVAQTGMGKTEAGLLWLANKKGFFTLPLRVSINAMYRRIIDNKMIGFSKNTPAHGEEATGLLHSTSLDFLYDTMQNEGNDAILEKVHSQSKQYANKLIISTIDQILKFPFYYLGYEKEYATMATSKVIIDELQAYDPNIAALLIRAMKLIDEIGGSFMVMTATLPEFYLNALQKEMSHSQRPLIYQEFIDDSVKRHHLKVRKASILNEDIVDEINQCSKTHKVLVICNTVKRAQEVYEQLLEADGKVRLLHSRFTIRDRRRLEEQILSFADSDETGVWVTTQLVEASLDIDFDVLYTEMSSLDSQFQRYGRCNRRGKKAIHEPNVHVLTENVSGISQQSGSVYHYEIYERSLQLLMKQGDGLLLESVKQQLIKKLYNEQNLEGTAFKREFEETMQQLRSLPPYEMEEKKAQQLLRQIYQVQAIPASFVEHSSFQEAVEKWRIATSKQDKRKYRQTIESYSVGVNEWRARQIGLTPFEGLKGLYYIHCDYCPQRGLLLQSLDYFD